MTKGYWFLYGERNDSIQKAVEKDISTFTGAFVCVALSTKELVAFRDPRVFVH